MNATSNQSGSSVSRLLLFLYGAIVYVLFLGTFTYAIGFVGNLLVPKGIDDGAVGPMSTAILVNALLLGTFAIQHTIMARPAFKAWWTRIIPAPIERSTFVLVTCVIMIAMYWQWRPMPEIVWQVTSPAASAVLWATCAFGWLLVLYSTFCIDHFDLFGLKQVWRNLRGTFVDKPHFVTPWLYKIIRNPLMAGFMIAFWATPVMSQGHLLFAIMTTGYMLFGIQVEERDLLRALGDDYRRFREETPMLLPLPRRKAKTQPAVA